MFSLIIKVFILLLSSIIYSARDRTKCLFLNDEPCTVRPILIDMNPVEFKFSQFMISLNKCTGSCNVRSPKICVSKETKDINVKAFNMIRNKNEAKAMTEHIAFDFKCKCNTPTCNLKQKWNNKTKQCKCKNYFKCKKDYSCNLSTCICDNSKYLKSIADTSATDCDELIIVMDISSTKKTNTITTNVLSTASTNCRIKKVRDCYIFHTFLLAIMLLLIIIIICYYYAK